MLSNEKYFNKIVLYQSQPKRGEFTEASIEDSISKDQASISSELPPSIGFPFFNFLFYFKIEKSFGFNANSNQFLSKQHRNSNKFPQKDAQFIIRHSLFKSVVEVCFLMGF